MIKTLVAYAVITAILSTFAVAYAIEVPVDEDKFDTSVLNCQEMEETGNLWCLWNPKPLNDSGYTGNQTNSEPGEATIIPDPKECPDRFYLTEDNECYPILTPGNPQVEVKGESSEIEFFEDLKVELEKDCANGCKSSDKKLLEILEDPLTFCFDGDNTSIYIQSPGTTIDPTGLIPDETDNASSHWLDELKQNREKCKADVVLDTQVHNEFHLNKAISHWWDKEITIPDWRAEMTLKYGIQYPKLTDESFVHNDAKVMKEVCYGTVWKNIDKMQFGCPDDSLYEPTEYDYDYQGIESQLNPFYDPIHSQEWQDMVRYKSGDQSQQLQKAIKVSAERQSEVTANYGGQK